MVAKLFLSVVLTLSLTASADSSLKGHWKLDELKGTTVNDSSGSNNGTIIGNYSWLSSKGKKTGALKLPGGHASKIDLGTNSNLDIGTGAFTITAWVKGSPSTARAGIAGKGGYSTNMGYYFRIYDGKLNGYINDGINKCGGIASIVVNNNEWHHVVMRCDRSTIKWYIDGSMDPTTVDVTSATGSLANGLSFYIGVESGGSCSWDGLIDDVRLYDRALTENEIKGLADIPLRTLYVKPDGDDTQDGESWNTAFKTISKAATVVIPGDLVLVKGGKYFEYVNITRPGTAINPIVFRAAKDETAIVTFGQEVTGWTKTAGKRFTYETNYANYPRCLWEDRTVRRYMEVYDEEELDKIPGSFLYDEGSDILKIHCLKGSAPDDAKIIVTPYCNSSQVPTGVKGYAWHAKGFFPYKADNESLYTHIENFTLCYQVVGIQLRMDDCEARNNIVYGNVVGISATRGDNLTVENNNIFFNYLSGINVGASGDNNVNIRRNYLFDNSPTGPYKISDTFGGNPFSMAVYSGPESFNIISNTVIAEDPDRPPYPKQIWRYKAIGNGKVVTCNNLLVGGKGHIDWNGDNMVADNTVIDGELWTRNYGGPIDETWKADHTELPGTVENNLYKPNASSITDADGFADRVRYDYRLREDSPNASKGILHNSIIRYVKPDGSNNNDGYSPSTAWKDIRYAISQLGDNGGTIYIMPGTYNYDLWICNHAPIESPLIIRSYEKGTVVIDTLGNTSRGIILRGSNIEVDGLIFRGFTSQPHSAGANIMYDGSNINAKNITIKNCVFDNCLKGINVSQSDSILIENNTFVNCGTDIASPYDKTRLVIRNNLFVDTTGTPLDLSSQNRSVVVSERNGFSNQVKLNNWTSLVSETHNSVFADLAGQISSSNGYLLPLNSEYGFAGLWHRPLGAKPAETQNSSITIENFKVESFGGDHVIVSWETPYDTPDAVVNCNGSNIEVDQDDCFLETKRYCKINGLTANTSYSATLNVSLSNGRTGTETVSFNTLAVNPVPKILYVATDGDDDNNGESPAQALKTISKAALLASSGSVIWVYPGIYHEQVRLWRGGTANNYFELRSIDPGEAVITCDQYRSNAIEANGTSTYKIEYLRIDGFTIDGLIYSGVTKGVNLNYVNEFIFTNNVFEPRDGNPDGTCSNLLLYLKYCSNYIVKNNLFVNGFSDLISYYSSGDITVSGNTFYGGGTLAVHFQGVEGTSQEAWKITNNIFVDTVGAHSSAGVTYEKPSSNLTMISNYNLYWRDTYPDMYLFGEGKYGSIAKAFTLAECYSMFGQEDNSSLGNPLFVNHAGNNFRLQSGSPAIELGENDEAVGYDYKIPDAHWKLDEASTASIAIDSTLNGNNGTFTNCTPGAAGTFGNAAAFPSGNVSKIDFGDNSGLDIDTGAFTISAWIKGNLSTNRAGIAGKGGHSTNVGYYFRIYDGKLNGYINDGTNKRGGTGSIVVNDNNWHHVVMRCDRSTIKWYIDGDMDPNTVDVTSVTGSLTNNLNFYIGAETTGNTSWNGNIDDVKLFKYALSEDEITELAAKH